MTQGGLTTLSGRNGPASWLFFEVGEARLAIPVSTLEEIVPLETSTIVPLAPPRIRGLMNLRGEALPLLDLAVFLELAPASGAESETVLVCRTRDYRVGVLCRRARGIREVDPKDEAPPRLAEPRRLRALARGEVEGPAGLDVLLDVDAMLEAARVGG